MIARTTPLPYLALRVARASRASFLLVRAGGDAIERANRVPAHRPSRAGGLLGSALLVPLVFAIGSCGSAPDPPEVEITTRSLAVEEFRDWKEPILSSSHPEITVRNVFVALGPCRRLVPELMGGAPREYVLRIVARLDEACELASRHIGYTAVIRRLPPGFHELRVVHITADGRRSAEITLQHPVVVTEPVAR